MEANTNPTPAPVKDKDRIHVLDAIRGIALLGILLMNIYIGGNYYDLEFTQALIADTGSPNFITAVIITIFFEGKMRALFCMLFGAGLMLYLIQKKRPDNPKGIWKLYYSRMFWLLLFGFFNAYVLLFYYDILYFYAIAGMIVFLLRNMKPRYKTMILPVIVLLGVVFHNLKYGSDRATRLAYLEAMSAKEQGAELSEEQNESVAAWDKLYAEMDFSGENLKEDTEKMKGDFSSVASVTYKKSREGQFEYLPLALADQIPLMLLGMALLQWGFFTGRWKKKWYLYTLIVGYAIGFPMAIYEFYQRYFVWSSADAILNYIDNNPYVFFFLSDQIQRIFLVMGHVSLIVLLHKAGAFTSLFRRFEAVGQMALTNYLMQSVMVTLFFFGYGLNFFNELQLYQLYFVVFAIWILQLIWSPIWLKYYKFGPCEWLWRTLTYRKRMPFKRYVPGEENLVAEKISVE
ncbi:DUF418 domain-containing protein [Robertkochia solimangrovi]|uniref:DUF418 domain-containing protein n=1 Tax=Robertkochia solimangrovi TaxID=2213046 RepID=UPI0011816FFD|nr:DUF418 domain-containing protein [Robertkochia solimangrovi]TRZ46246.1 hypothetical protein DMZ48_03030 [Robertkochia solimangrovi]